MKKLFILLTVLFICIRAYTQTPSWLWAKSAGGTGNDLGLSVAVDASGNSYVAGAINSSSVTFGSTTLTNAGGYDIFLVKYDAGGNVQWAKGAGGTGNDFANSVAVDASGNTYITGSFESPTVTFGSTVLTNADNTGNSPDLFLVKYDANGTVLWAKCASGATNFDEANSVAVDASGSVYIAGYFYGNSITFGAITLTNTDSSGYSNTFLVKYDATGNALWAESSNGGSATSVTVDASGNTYLTGYFNSSTVTFGSTMLTNDSVGSADIFLAKYNATGNVLWAKSAGGSDLDEANSVAVDVSGNAYIAGEFYSRTITFGYTNLTNADTTGSTCASFLTKYDANGNILWAKSLEGTDDEANSVAVDSSGNTYLVGWFYCDVLTVGSTTLTNMNAGYADIFLAKYDANGNVLWAKSAGETSNDFAISVAVNASGNTFIAGFFEASTITFGATTLTNAFAGHDDIFVAKTGNSVGINELSNSLKSSVYPNPATCNITIEAPQQAVIEISNIQGQLIKTFATTGNKTIVDVSALQGGVYVVEVKTEKGIEVRKFIKE